MENPNKKVDNSTKIVAVFVLVVIVGLGLFFWLWNGERDTLFWCLGIATPVLLLLWYKHKTKRTGQ